MKRNVAVTIMVEMEVDETKFTPEFMTEFRASMYNFRRIEDHIEHLSQLAAREILSREFIEGYGPPADFGINYRIVGGQEEIVD